MGYLGKRSRNFRPRSDNGGARFLTKVILKRTARTVYILSSANGAPRVIRNMPTLTIRQKLYRAVRRSGLNHYLRMPCGQHDG